MRRIEPAAVLGVMSREVANFRTFWRSTTFSSLIEPMIYLLAFGLGLGTTLVSGVDGIDYVQFVGTGMVATAVVFSSALPAMFGTFVKHRFQRTYDAILAAPVDVEELVSGEMLWIGLRAGVFGTFPLLVTIGFGLDPAPGMLLVPFFSPDHRPRIRRLRHRGRGQRREDRPVQLRNDARHHADVPARRDLLPDRPAPRLGPGPLPAQPAPPARRPRPRCLLRLRAGPTCSASPGSSCSPSRCGGWRSRG